jgi:hypothetical protein
MDDLTLLSARAAWLREKRGEPLADTAKDRIASRLPFCDLATSVSSAPTRAHQKRAVSPELVDRAFASAAARGVSDQRLHKLLTRYGDWTRGTMRARRVWDRGLTPEPAVLRSSAYARERRDVGPESAQLLHQLRSKLAPILHQDALAPPPLPGRHTYGSRASNQLRQAYGLEKLPHVPAERFQALGNEGRFHPQVGARSPVPAPEGGAAPAPPPPVPPPPSFGARHALAATGLGAFGAGALAGRASGGAPEPAPVPQPQGPAPSIRKLNTKAIGSRLMSASGNWWSRMRARYGGAPA